MKTKKLDFQHRQPGFSLNILFKLFSFFFSFFSIPKHFFCFHDTFHSVDAPFVACMRRRRTKRSLIIQRKIKSDAHYIIAAIESKYFYICIFFYKIFRHCLDIIFSCARDIRFPVSQL
jgi:hypothetical protein